MGFEEGPPQGYISGNIRKFKEMIEDPEVSPWIVLGVLTELPQLTRWCLQN